jgi:hypothetical protein
VRGELRPVVEDRDVEAEEGADLREGNREVAGAHDEEGGVGR